MIDWRREYGRRGVPGSGLRRIVEEGQAIALNFDDFKEAEDNSLNRFPARSSVAVEWPESVFCEVKNFGAVPEDDFSDQLLVWLTRSMKPDSMIIVFPYQVAETSVVSTLKDFTDVVDSVLEEIPEFWAWFPDDGKFLQFGSDWVAELGDIPAGEVEG